MGKYDFNKIIDRSGTYNIKWDYIPSPAPKDALPLWIADMDFPCSDEIIHALHKRVDNLIFGYTMYNNKELKDSITNWFKKRYDWVVDESNVFYSPGIVPAIAFLVRILSDENDGIVIQPPVYYPFALKIEGNNRKVVDNPLIYKDGRYTIDFDHLDQVLSEDKNKGLVFCNPHNPGGRVWSEEELKKVIEICKKHNKWIVTDEIHSDLTRKDIQFTPLEKVAGDYKDQIITCTAPSKAFNMAGLKMSNLIINSPSYIEKYNKFISDELSIGSACPLSIAATIAAYNESEQWLDEVTDYIDENINFAMDFFKKEMPLATVVYPEATYLLWVDLKKYEPDPKKLENILCTEAKVYVNQGYVFGEGGDGFIRINTACPRSVLEECLNRIKNAF